MSFATVTESDVIKGVYVVEPTAFGDARGRFVESYRRSWFPRGREMVQGNRSDKTAGTVVGQVRELGLEQEGRPLVFYRGGYGRFEL